VKKFLVVIVYRVSEVAVRSSVRLLTEVKVVVRQMVLVVGDFAEELLVRCFK